MKKLKLLSGSKVSEFLLKQIGQDVLWWNNYIGKEISKKSYEIKGSGGLQNTGTNL